MLREKTAEKKQALDIGMFKQGKEKLFFPPK